MGNSYDGTNACLTFYRGKLAAVLKIKNTNIRRLTELQKSTRRFLMLGENCHAR